MQHWYNFAAKLTYTAMADGSVLGWDYGAKRESFVYSPRVKAVVVSELTPAWPLGPTQDTTSLTRSRCSPRRTT